MTTTVTFNTNLYALPTSGESGWDVSVRGLLTDLAANATPASTTTALTSVVSGHTTTLATHASQIASLQDDVPGRNFVRNSQFSTQLRGAGPFTSSSIYTIDGWYIQKLNGTNSLTAETAADSDRAGIGDEEVEYFCQDVFAGTSGSTDFVLLTQRIENLRRLAGKTVTLSFWSNASIDMGVGVELVQVFGTGGSPSSLVTSIGKQKLNITGSTWARYTTTAMVIPSVAGKTLGSNGDNYTGIIFWLSAGSGLSSRASSVGVQTATFKIWGVQLEIGTAATDLDRVEPHANLAWNQRFFQNLTCSMQSASTGTMGMSIPFATLMRTTPTQTNSVAGTLSNATILAEAATDAQSVFLQISATGAGGYLLGRVNHYSAEL